MQEILSHFPPSTINNSRNIIGSLMRQFIGKPSFGLEKRLREVGIGVEWSDTRDPDEFAKAEGFYIIDKELVNLTEDELMELL